MMNINKSKYIACLAVGLILQSSHIVADDISQVVDASASETTKRTESSVSPQVEGGGSCSGPGCYLIGKMGEASEKGNRLGDYGLGYALGMTPGIAGYLISDVTGSILGHISDRTTGRVKAATRLLSTVAHLAPYVALPISGAYKGKLAIKAMQGESITKSDAAVAGLLAGLGAGAKGNLLSWEGRMRLLDVLSRYKKIPRKWYF